MTTNDGGVSAMIDKLSQKCVACAGTGEDFHEGDPCDVCGGSGDASKPGPMVGRSLAAEYMHQQVALKMQALDRVFQALPRSGDSLYDCGRRGAGLQGAKAAAKRKPWRW